MKSFVHFLAPAILLFCLVPQAMTAPPATQPDQNQFIRFVEDGNGGGKLQTSIVNYTNGAGVSVALISALHVGEKSYYEGLNKTFESYDALLYEMIKPKGMRPPAPGEQSRSAISSFQRFLKNVLNLDFQLDDIDYTKANFVHADLDAETFAQMQEQRGESILGIMLRSMLREMGREMAGENHPRAQIGMLDLIAVMGAPDRARQLKLLLARQFDDIEEQMAGLDGPNGSVIITERNKKCLETLKKAIDDGNKKIGIFYGGGHMHDMSGRLEAMGFHQTSIEWRIGWDMTTPTTQPAPATRSAAPAP